MYRSVCIGVLLGDEQMDNEQNAWCPMSTGHIIERIAEQINTMSSEQLVQFCKDNFAHLDYPDNEQNSDYNFHNGLVYVD